MTAGLACVWCASPIDAGSWCAKCRARELAKSSTNYHRSRRPRSLDDDAACDCGRPMPSSAEACSRCCWLDLTSARSPLAKRIVEFLRVAVRATLLEIAAAAYTSKRACLQVIRQLQRLGRLDAKVVEVDTGTDLVWGGRSSRIMYQLRS